MAVTPAIFGSAFLSDSPERDSRAILIFPPRCLSVSVFARVYDKLLIAGAPPRAFFGIKTTKKVRSEYLIFYWLLRNASQPRVAEECTISSKGR